MTPAARDPHTPRAWPFLAALVPFLLLVWRFDFLVDDAFISWRYAQNLAAGNGLVFNIGEAHPVEGYTNLLWVLVMAVVHAVGLDPALASRAISVACGVALVWLFSGVVTRTHASRAGAVLTGLFLGTLPPLAVWATGGLETMAFALCVFGVHERLSAARGGQAGAFAVLATLLRADGFVWVAIVLAAALVTRRREPGLERALTRAALLFAIAVIGVAAWRWLSYGEFAPNTARAKVHLGALSLERGGLYVLSMLLAIPSIALAMIASLRARSSRALEAGLVVLGGCAYLILVGGDWMMMYRLLVPALPFVALLGLFALEAAGSTARVVLGLSCVALSLLPSFNTHPVPISAREAVHFRWGLDYSTEYEVWHKGVVDIEEWITLGRGLALHVKPGESYVLGNIGAIPYYSGLIAHDTHGLTNREPFAPVPEGQRAQPGHERSVPIRTFDRYQPTYRGLQLAPADDPFQRMPANWTNPDLPVSKTIEIEIAPLDPALGFPEDTVLQIVRNVW